MGLAIICLSIGNAVTGHGIKGNLNLNMAVLANATNNAYLIYTVTSQLLSETTSYVYNNPPPPGKKCQDTEKVFKITCPVGGYTNCTPGTRTETTTTCFVPD